MATIENDRKYNPKNKWITNLFKQSEQLSIPPGGTIITLVPINNTLKIMLIIDNVFIIKIII